MDPRGADVDPRGAGVDPRGDGVDDVGDGGGHGFFLVGHVAGKKMVVAAIIIHGNIPILNNAPVRP